MPDAPNPPYCGPPAHSSGTANKPISRVVIHCTVSPCEVGGAKNICAYFRSPGSSGSAHYIVDPGMSVQSAYDSVICWHAPPNTHSIGIELCDPMKGSGARWDDAEHRKMLQRAADLTAGLCLAYDVPIRKIGPKGLRAGHDGICGHVDVSAAWYQSSHYDPGTAFPWPRFMALVRQSAHQQRAPDKSKSKQPAPELVDEKDKPTLVARARILIR